MTLDGSASRAHIRGMVSKVQGRADRMIATARRLGQHVETVNGTLCVVCVEGADPAGIQRRVGAWEGCYNCGDTPESSENRPKRECFCHPGYNERDHRVAAAARATRRK